MQELIQQAQAGDAEARERLLAELRPHVQRWAEQALSQRFAGKIDASDIAQETLLDVSRKIAQFIGSSEEAFLEWAREALRRDVIDAIRRSTARCRSTDRERSLDDTQDGGSPLRDKLASELSTPSRQAMRHERAIALHEALKRLPEDQAQAIRLKHIDGLPLDEVAQRLHRSKEAVAKLLQRGMLTLKGHLRD